MAYAVFVTGGKQYRVTEGDEIFIEKLEASEGKVVFDKVLAILDDKEPKIGDPYVKGATVTAGIVKTGKAKKIIVFKMHPKKGYRRKQGHRQPYTKIKIEKITQKAAKS
ncbi:MAG: 50S ribosomal protein L21 [Oscillospiraceae bacterium]|nr:50S ribosomal protein L21 [Oscillospiraceae bacterium]